jgi:hypothetical protein
VDSWTSVLGLLCGICPPGCGSELGYSDPVALGCGIARNYDFYFRSDDSHPNLLDAPHDKARLTLFLRDLTLSAGVALAASQNGTAQAPRTDFQSFAPKLITVARFVMAISIAVYGVEHFLYPTAAPGIPPDGPS